MKKARIPLSKVLKSHMKDPEFCFYYEQEEAITRIAHMVRSARQHAQLTQAELAKQSGTTQSAIARLESGSDSRIPSLDLLQRIAKALKAKLLISFAYGKVA